MRSLYDFIIKPIGERYSNEVKVGDKKLVLNTKIESFKFVNRKAIVVETPLAFNTSIQKGDTIIVHQNIFRRFYNMSGKQQNSRSYFKDGLYFASIDQIYLYKRKDNWKATKGYCFVQPIKSDNELSIDIEHETKGVVKYTDGSFEIGELVGFEPFSKYEFIVDGEKLYRVYSKFITIKYEYQGNEETYNPSWAQSS